MNLRGRLLSSSVYRLLNNLVLLLVTFLLTPFLIAHLGESNYGLWLLLLSILAWIKLFEFGIPEAAHRQLALAIEKTDSQRVSVVYSCSIVIFLGLGLFAAGIAILVGRFPALLGVEQESYAVVTSAFLVLSLKVFWDFGMNAFYGFYSGLIRYDVDANIDSLKEIIKASLMFFLVPELLIYGAIIAVLAADLVGNAAKIFYVRRIYGKVRFDPGLVNAKEFAPLLSYAKHVLLNNIAIVFSGRTSPFIISHLFNLGAITIFGVANRLVTMIEGLLLSVLGNFQPVFIRLLERNNRIDDKVRMVLSLNFFLVSVFFIPLIILSENFFRLWLGAGFDQSATVVFILSYAYLCRTVSRPISAALLASANHRALPRVNMLGVVVNVTASLGLGYLMGLEGVALGMLLGFLTSDVGAHLVLYSKVSNEAIAPILWQFLKTALLMLGLSLLGITYLENMPPLSWLQLIVWSVLIFAGATIIMWISVLSTAAKQQIALALRSGFAGKLPES